MSKNNFIEELKNTISANFDSNIETEWHGITLRIKRFLPMEEMMIFVNNVVSACFAADTGEYLPEIKDFALRCSIFESYTGVDLPRGLSEKFNLVYSSDIISFITQFIDEGQFNAMLIAIDCKMQHLAQSNIEALTMKMNELVSEFSTIEQNLSGIFGDVDNETITKIADAIADGSFDETKLVKAFANNVSNDDENIISFQDRGK